MSDSGEAPTRLVGRWVSKAQIAGIKEVTRTFRTLDNAHGEIRISGRGPPQAQRNVAAITLVSVSDPGPDFAEPWP